MAIDTVCCYDVRMDIDAFKQKHPEVINLVVEDDGDVTVYFSNSPSRGLFRSSFPIARCVKT